MTGAAPPSSKTRVAGSILLIVVFLVAEPAGLAGIWRRLRLYFRMWPFSY